MDHLSGSCPGRVPADCVLALEKRYGVSTFIIGIVDSNGSHSLHDDKAVNE